MFSRSPSLLLGVLFFYFFCLCLVKLGRMGKESVEGLGFSSCYHTADDSALR